PPAGGLQLVLRVLGEPRRVRRTLDGGELVVVADELCERGRVARVARDQLLVALYPFLGEAVAASAATALEGVQQAAGRAAADAKEDEAAAHQKGEHQVGDLDRSPALA